MVGMSGYMGLGGGNTGWRGSGLGVFCVGFLGV